MQLHMGLKHTGTWKLLCKLMLGGSRRREENKRLGVKEIGRLCRLTTTALTTTEKPLKAVIMSNKRNPGKPQLQRRTLRHLFYKLPAEHTTKSLTSQWISESSINVCTAVVVCERALFGRCLRCFDRRA